jgi:actin related protein 2/3 complex subunit 1A/1B
VLSCAFHPQSGQLLATGCADFRCRVLSTFDADADGASASVSVCAGPFGAPLEFGEVHYEAACGGWVDAVAWSPSGNELAFAGIVRY